MRSLSFFIALLAFACTASTASAQKQFGFDNRKSSTQPYMTPAETVAKFTVPPEFEVKLFAGEPDVANPIAFTIDERGRVWVVECMEYPSKAGKNVPRDRIVILEDTDGDGACDKRTIFAEGKDFPVTDERKKAGLGAFDMASGIEVGHGGVFIGAPPYLWFIENKNDKPGKFEVLLKGFGSQDTHETLNTFQWGPDGWLYGLHGIYTQSNIYNANPDDAIKMNAAVWRFHPKSKKFEIFSEGTSNPWGMDWRNTDGQFILACCVIPHLFHMVPGGVYRRQGGISNNPYAYGAIQEICDHTFHKESGWAHAGLISLDVPHMPEKYRNSVIFGSIHGCMLKQNILKPNGSSFTASRGDNFLESGDKNVRPINLRWGPLGDIYMIDWHDQNPCHQAAADSWDYVRGRVYRIQLKGTVAKKAEDLSTLTPVGLAKAAGGENPYLARTALRLIHEKSPERNADIEHAWSKLAQSPEILAIVRSRVGYALQPDRMDHTLFELEDSSPKNVYRRLPKHQMVWAISQVSNTDKLNDKVFRVWAIIASQTVDVEVRRELASAAVRHAGKVDVLPLLHALMLRKEDAKDPLIPHLLWLAYEKVLVTPQMLASQAKELEWIRLTAIDNPLTNDAIVPRVMRRFAATGKPENLAACLKFIHDAGDPAVREKALEGLTTELANRTVNAPAGWAAVRDDLAKDPKLAPLVNKLAVSFQDPAAIRRALEIATNRKLPVDQRTEAIRQLALLKVKTLGTFLSLAQDDPHLAVRTEAIRALAVFDSDVIPTSFLAMWPEQPRELRGEVVNLLATRKEWAKALLTAMAEKKIDRTAVSDNTILRIHAFKDKDLDALIEKAWGRTRPTPAELTAIIDKTRDSLGSGEASFARGKLVFENHCAKCHNFDGKGADVGPALDGAARDIEYIVTNVLDPNRVIGAPYFLRIARLADGRVEQGVLAEEDDKFVTLKVENGALKKIAKADLDSPIQVVEKSLMPEGLTGGMSPQDFRDLVRYVMAHPFLATATINGERSIAGVTGRFTLPGGKSETTLEAEVAANDDVKTQLLVGASADYEVKLDGHPLAAGPATARPTAPDQASHVVTLTKGTHRLTLVVKDKGIGGTVYLRLLDPDRKLRFAEK